MTKPTCSTIDLFKTSKLNKKLDLRSKYLYLVVLKWYIHFVNNLFLIRYMDLTEDEKERLKGFYKVAKKLEKMENISNQNR